MIDTPCPDCDPHGFDANLEKHYGPPVMMGNIKIYADARIHRHEMMVDAKSFARSLCKKHGRPPTSEKDPR